MKWLICWLFHPTKEYDWSNCGAHGWASCVRCGR
jgi:hypothetical protein